MLDNWGVFPDSLEVSGISYTIKTSYLDWIAFDVLLNNSKIDDVGKLEAAIRLYETPPVITKEAIRKIFWFYMQGNETKIDNPKRKESSLSNSSNELIFDYSKDAYLIRTSFLKVYNIDLYFNREMHWWKFRELLKPLLSGIAGDNPLSNVIGYRATDLSKLKGRAKARAISLKETFSISDDGSKKLTLEEQNEIMLKKAANIKARANSKEE